MTETRTTPARPTILTVAVEYVPLAELDDYLTRHGFELAHVVLDCRHAVMYATAETRPRGTGGPVKVVQVG